MTLRLLLADDHALLREGIKRILSRAEDIRVVGEAADGEELLRLARSVPFDVLVTDLSMPGRGGLELIRTIKAHHPHCRILVLSMHHEPEYAVRAIRLGAHGYLTKDCTPEIIEAAVRKVAAGGVFIAPEVAEQLALGSFDAHRPAHESLSPREFDVFRLFVGGLTVTQIGQRLHLSVKTVSSHKASAMQKLNVQSGSELVRYALKYKLTEPLEP